MGRWPMTSPPGGGQAASPKRASSGPMTMKLARRLSTSSLLGEVEVTRPAFRRRDEGDSRSTSTPRSSRTPSHVGDVADVGQVLQVAVVGGQEGSGHRGHGGVLGAADRDAAPQRVSPLDDKAFSHSACLW